MAEKVKLLVIGGPTGSGKTDLALELAEAFDAEIINADSVQIYKEMDIGTAKPPQHIRERILHHLFDVADISFPWDVKRYETEAFKVIHQVAEKRKLPILVGGSGFYIKGLLEGVPQEAKKDAVLRDRLSFYSTEKLYRMLKEVDIERARKIHPHDRKRIIRALEIYFVTGKKPSSFGFGKEERFDALKIAIMRNREELKDRIYKRVDEMMKKGFLEEVKRLADKYGRENPVLKSTLGYRELLSYLEGEISLDDAVELIKKRTWDYAKRQISWFKKEGFEFFIIPQEKEKLIETIAGWIEC